MMSSGVKRATKETAPWRYIEKAFLPEHNERFTDRTATHIKRIGDGVLIDFDSRFQSASEDQISYVAGDLIQRVHRGVAFAVRPGCKERCQPWCRPCQVPPSVPR